METSEVRRRLTHTIERAKKLAAERRSLATRASSDYDLFLERTAIPMVRQLAGALTASGFPFAVYTPGGGVRLASERSRQDFIELSFDASGDRPIVLGHTRRSRGGRLIDSERPIASQDVSALSDEEVLVFFLEELQPFLER